MLLLELRTEIVRYAQKMYDSHLVRATQGNLSARDPRSGFICITPSGIDYHLLRAEDIVVLDEDGNVVEGERRPSSETPLHLHVLRCRRDIHCVMHTHSLYATAFSVIYEPIPIVLSDSALYLGDRVPVAPFCMPGTWKFAELIVETLNDGAAVLWGNHGAMVAGVNLAHAFSLAHALEDSARVYAIAKQLGEPVLLPTEEVIKLRDLLINK